LLSIVVRPVTAAPVQPHSLFRCGWRPAQGVVIAPATHVRDLGLPPDGVKVTCEWWGKEIHDEMERTIPQFWCHERDYGVAYDQVQGSPDAG